MTILGIKELATAARLDPKPLPDFLVEIPALTQQEKLQIVDQALLLMDELYVHLPFKRAMYAIDPVQSLKLLRHRLPDDLDFHEAMISIFMSVRDLHTNYILPQPYRSATAMLPFKLGEYYVDNEPRYIILATAVNYKSFRPGVPVTHWNGTPIARAVKLNARSQAGGNEAARHARGLQRMTVRPLMMSLPPTEDWIDVRYLDADGNALERRFRWNVVRPPVVRLPESSGEDLSADTIGYLMTLGIDTENELVNHIIETIFEPKQMQIDEDILRFLKSGPQSGTRSGASETVSGPDFNKVSKMPNVFRFNKVNTPKGEIGRIQIRTFGVRDPDAFVAEFVRIASLLPQDRLVIDVRNNGGGNIIAGEKLLQTLTDSTIEAERLHFINTSLVLKMAEATPAWFSKWLPSLRRAVMTGAIYSQGLPLIEQEGYNQIGRQYPGKVLLITDAFCYSTTDIFAAGFRDHKIGPILGTADNTGAGGANVFDWRLVNYLCSRLDDNPIQLPSSGASFRVAIRRTTRVGENAGVPLEDLGVEPDEVHRRTLTDLTENDTELYAHAADLLEQW